MCAHSVGDRPRHVESIHHARSLKTERLSTQACAPQLGPNKGPRLRAGLPRCAVRRDGSDLNRPRRGRSRLQQNVIIRCARMWCATLSCPLWGQTRKLNRPGALSALPCKPDLAFMLGEVRDGPLADITRWSADSVTDQKLPTGDLEAILVRPKPGFPALRLPEVARGCSRY
jgi:hypothetical protein